MNPRGQRNSKSRIGAWMALFGFIVSAAPFVLFLAGVEAMAGIVLLAIAGAGLAVIATGVYIELRRNSKDYDINIGA